MVARRTTQVLYDPHGDWKRHNPKMVQLHSALQPHIDEMVAKVDAQEGDGLDVSGPRQALTELHWRLSKTADVSAAIAWYDKTVIWLNQDNPPSAMRKQASDGSYGACASAWWIRLTDSSDWFIADGWHGKRPDFLDEINSPDLFGDYARRLLVSDIPAYGIDNSPELNNGVTTLVQLVFKQAPSNYSYHPGLKEALRAFLREWQDPKTGFFGAWYRVDGQPELVKLPNLSATYHVANYTKRENPSIVQDWPRLIDTLLAIKNHEYPYGWVEHDQDGNLRMYNHHNCDVVKLFKFGWKYMRRDQQEQVRAEIQIMLEWALTTIDSNGVFYRDGLFHDGTSEGGVQDYSFFVAFLSEIGYFDEAQRFWVDQSTPQDLFKDASKVQKQLRNQVKRFIPDPWITGTLEELGVQF